MLLQMAAFIEAQPESPAEVEELATYLLDKVKALCPYLSCSRERQPAISRRT